MVDIAILASDIWTSLQPYIPVLATKAAEEIGKKVPEAIINIWNAVKTKFESKPTAKEGLNDLANSPEDLDTQASFRKELKKALTEDQTFVADLARLLYVVDMNFTSAQINDSAIAQGNNTTAIHGGGVYVRGDNINSNIVTGTNNIINTTRKSPNSTRKR